MMMRSVELYRSLEARGRHADRMARGRLAPPRLVPERMEELQRQAGWAKTFGLPLELISRAGGDRSVPADVEGRRARRRVPADGRLHRSGAADVRADRVGEAGGRRGQHEHARHRDRRRARPGDAACAPTGATSRPSVVVNAGGIFAREIGAMAGVNVPIIPMAHEYLITKPMGLPARPADDARPVAPRVLPRRGRRAGRRRLRAEPGAVVRWTASRRTSTASCWPRTGSASSRSW